MCKDNGIIRDYKDSDYEACESLVACAWKFDAVFKPQELSDIAKCMYTKGSVIASNFRKVVEIKGKTVGFIFGYNEKSTRPKKGIWFGLNILRRIFCVRQMRLGEKIALLKAINTHAANRLEVVSPGRSEIVLFVVSTKYQGNGYGKLLLSGFIDHCRSSGVESIIVETNALEAGGFYERAGFAHLGDFASPLHAYITRDGQPCMYEYRLTQIQQ